MSNAKPVNYVNPQEFYEEMLAFHKTHCHLPKGERPPKIPDSIGKKIMLICERLSHSRKFFMSPHREEMVLDAIETCITYIRNFDPAISKNPFAYFTQLAYYSFIQRAGKERKEFLTKVNWVQQVAIHEVLDHVSDIDRHDMDDIIKEFANNLSVYMNYTETPGIDSSENKSKPAKRTTLAYQKKQAEKRLAEKEVETEEVVVEEESFLNV